MKSWLGYGLFLSLLTLSRGVSAETTLMQQTGALEPGDFTLEDGSFYDPYEFEGEAGQGVVLQATSDEFDTYLLLLDSQGQLIAENNDWNGDKNSTLAYVLPEAGMYQIWVNAYAAAEQGSYRLAMEFVAADHPIIREAEGDWLNSQGMAFVNSAEYSEALELFEQSLAVRQEIGDRRGEGQSLHNIAAVYDRLGEYSQALELYGQALSTRREIGDRLGEATTINNIGFIHDAIGEYPKALELYEQSLAIRREISDRKGEAESLSNIGNVSNNLGEYSNALELYEQSLTIHREIGDRKGEARLLNNIGFIYWRLGNYSKTLELYEQSLEIVRELGDRHLEGASLNNIGSVYDALGEYSKALELYEQSLVLIRQIKDLRTEGKLLSNIASIYTYLGEYSKALELYEQSLKISQDIGDPHGEGITLSNIGSVYDRQGDYPRALELYEQALMLHQEIGNRYGEGHTTNKIGLTYDRLGQYPRALDLYEQSLVIHREIGDRKGEAESLNNIGSIYNSLGDYLEALSYYEQSLEISQKIGDRRVEGINLNNMGQTYDLLGEYDKALELHMQSLKIHREIGDRESEAGSLNNIGVLYYEHLGEYEKALELYEQSLTISQEIGDRRSEGMTLNNIGYVLESLEYPVLAIVYLKQSINVFEAIRTSNRDLAQESQEAFTEQVADSYRSLADLLLQQDRVLEAQRVLDLLKVQELDDYLGGVRSQATTASGIDLLPQEASFWADRAGTLARAIPLATELQQLRQTPFPSRTQAENDRIQALELEQGEILDQFLAFIASEEVQAIISQLERTVADPEQDVITQLNRFPTLQDNLEAVGNAVLLYPLILEDRLELVLVTPDGPPTRHPVAIPRDQLTAKIAEFQGLLRDKHSNPQPLAQELYQLLVEPLETALTAAATETIIYAPDGPLRYIPLAALHDGEGWLAQRYKVNHITAASLTDLNLRPARQPVVLAGAFQEGRHEFTVGEKSLAFAGLPYAGIEVDLLQEAFPTTPFYDDGFSRRAVEPLMNDHSIVHLATHAALLVGSPLDSFILFGNGERLTLEDLKSWRGRLRSVDLVVLSACETGTGSIKDASGEEILGFGYLMQDAGARAVLSSLWPVSDGGTQELMTNFYAALQVPGMTKAEALQQAQIALIEGNQIDPGSGERFTRVPDDPEAAQRPNARLAHPYYWAPFILIGNGL